MASCQTSQWVDGANYVKLTVTESSNTATSSTLSWTLQYITTYPPTTSYAKAYTVTLAGSTVKEGTYDINGKNGTYTVASGTKTITKTKSAQTISFGVSFSFMMTWSGQYVGTLSASGNISVPAITSYTISYNANGGSGAPGSQTKWHGTNITLSSTKPTRTGYTFQGWGTSSSDTSVDYASGATYSANASDTLYAIWKANTYTVSYNANGGSGAPGSQTKTYGVNLTLSSTKPTRTNYTFKGWGTSASAITVAYAAGGTYSGNSAITLYAIWSLSYAKPRITNVSVYRCNSSGTSTESGTYTRVSFSWTTDKTVSLVTIVCNSITTTVSASGTSGSVNRIVGDGALSTDSTYEIKITVSDASGSTSTNRQISGTIYPIDFLPGGRGTAIGKAAEKNNWFDVGFASLFRNKVESNYDDAAYVQEHEKTGLRVGFGIGSGGVNYGIYNKTTGKWAFYADANDVYFGPTRYSTYLKPYYGPGDYKDIYVDTAGICTNNKTYVYFTIFMCRPILPTLTVSITTTTGFVMRSTSGSYTHGCTNARGAVPDSISAPTINHDAGVLRIRAVYSDVTNAVNNTPIGIYGKVTVTFS